MRKINRILGVSTSMHFGSRSRQFLQSLDLDKYDGVEYKQMNLVDDEYQDLNCTACENCVSSNSCKLEANNIILDAFLQSDIIIISAPIYYGSLTGKTKLLMECFHPFRAKQLEDKELILVLSSAKEGQEGIAVMQFLIWCHTHQIKLVQVVTIHDETTENDNIRMIDDIRQSILDFNLRKEIDVYFENFKYIGKSVGIPIYYDIKKIED